VIDIHVYQHTDVRHSNDRFAMIQMGMLAPVSRWPPVSWCNVEGLDDCHLVLVANARTDEASADFGAVLELARASEKFRRRLLSDPRAAIPEDLKLALPKQLAVHVHPKHRPRTAPGLYAVRQTP
jgi:hypothetical protein